MRSISEKNFKIIIYLESPINWCNLLHSLWCQVSFISSLSHICPSSFHWSYYHILALKSETGNKKALWQLNMKKQHLNIKIKTTIPPRTDGGLLYILQMNLRQETVAIWFFISGIIEVTQLKSHSILEEKFGDDP